MTSNLSILQIKLYVEYTEFRVNIITITAEFSSVLFKHLTSSLKKYMQKI